MSLCFELQWGKRDAFFPYPTGILIIDIHKIILNLGFKGAYQLLALYNADYLIFATVPLVTVHTVLIKTPQSDTVEASERTQ